jgi:hypothetical protein
VEIAHVDDEVRREGGRQVGDGLESSQAWNSPVAMPGFAFIRQPVSPIMRSRRTWAFGKGSERSPSVARAVPAGIVASQVVTGNTVGPGP